MVIGVFLDVHDGLDSEDDFLEDLNIKCLTPDME